eukprot:scaffold223842_cov26-Tisochrysis_lutea.AAC.1
MRWHLAEPLLSSNMSKVRSRRLDCRLHPPLERLRRFSQWHPKISVPILAQAGSPRRNNCRVGDLRLKDGKIRAQTSGIRPTPNKRRVGNFTLLAGTCCARRAVSACVTGSSVESSTVSRPFSSEHLNTSELSAPPCSRSRWRARILASSSVGAISDSDFADSASVLGVTAGIPGSERAAASAASSSPTGQAVTETTAARGKLPAT